MMIENRPSRRSFVACCLCAGCAGIAGAAESSSRNSKSLKSLAAQGGASGTQPEAKKNFEIAYCGIYCASCELHLKGNRDGKKCKGCTHPAMTSKCAIFKCAKEKKVANCGLCDQFETCAKLLKHHEKPLYRQVARRTCTAVKAEGLAVVAGQQKKRWTCPHCGKIFPWNTKGTCPHCGKPVEMMSEKDA